eukprot:PhM_4_TR9813/c2_g1_i4/m.21892
MSTKNINVFPKAKETYLKGYNYEGTEIYKVNGNVSDSYATTYCQPQSVSTGGHIQCHITFSEDYNIEDIDFEFTITNNDGILSLTIFNPWLLMQEVKIMIDNQSFIHLASSEEIFTTVAHNVRVASNVHEVYNKLQKCMSSNFSTPLTGETIPPGGSATFSLPLFEFLATYLKGISPSQGFHRFSFEARFNPNLGTESGNGRFIASSTANNPWTKDIVTISDCQLRQRVTRTKDPILRQMVSPLMVVQRFQEKVYPISFNATTANLRLQINNLFSHYPHCNCIYVYSYNPSGVTAYNDADCCKVDSDVNLLGWELKLNTKTVHKMDASTDKAKKVKYYSQSFEKEHGRPINPDLLSNSTDFTKFWTLTTKIDLSNIGVGVNDNNRQIYSGISSANDLELTIYNTSGAYSTATYLYVMLGYLEFFKLSPNGELIEVKL